MRLPAVVYRSAFNGLWPICFMLFGTYFGGRLAWERRRSWIKWVLLAPVAVFAAAIVVATLVESLDLRNLAALHRAITAGQPLGQLFAMASVSFFFLIVGWKSGVADSADARRRLRLVQRRRRDRADAGARARGRELGPRSAGSRRSRSGSSWLGFIFMPVFPLTLAYVILVDRAMDVRVAVRQGLRYAVTRGVIRVVVVAVHGGRRVERVESRQRPDGQPPAQAPGDRLRHGRGGRACRASRSARSTGPTGGSFASPTTPSGC